LVLPNSIENAVSVHATLEYSLESYVILIMFQFQKLKNGDSSGNKDQYFHEKRKEKCNTNSGGNS